jgi:uncharacterized membrane protein
MPVTSPMIRGAYAFSVVCCLCFSYLTTVFVAVYVIAYAYYLSISQVRAVCLGLRLLPNLAIDKERTGEMLFTQLCFNKHTIIHITHIATLLLLTRFHFDACFA